MLAYETTLKEARAQSIALDDHVAHLVVHGVLHLIGFDHLEDIEAERMEAIERTALASLGIADPYADAMRRRRDEQHPHRRRRRSGRASSASPTRRHPGSIACLQTFGLGEEPDLRELIEDALARSKSDTLSAQERGMLRRILRFGKLTVEDVMVPRADIIAVDDSVTIDELMRVFRQAEHSRLPVYHETLDDPRGMIHIRDLMSWITAQAEAGDGGRLNLGKVDLQRSIGTMNITRDLLYVPDSMSVLDLLLKMQTTRLHLALVVDEYGGTDGLVSIEDLVEEVVGDIADEHDVEDEPLIRTDPRLGLIADARMPIEDLEKHLGVSSSPRSRKKTSTRSAGLCSPSPAASRRAASWCVTRAASSSRCWKPIRGGSRSCASTCRARGGTKAESEA